MQYVKEITCLETGECFAGCKDAADAAGVCLGYMANICRERKTCKGMHYKYTGKMIPYLYCKNNVKVRRCSDGKTYPTIAEASKDNFISAGYLSNCLRNDKPCCGLEFEYVK